MQKMTDQLGRKIDYLRISITDRCNLRCRYCMPADGVENKSHQEILSYEDLIKVVKVAIKFGIKKIRITGGEPLVRLGVEDFIADLNQLDLEDISMTSNAVLLADKAEDLKKAGLDRINISLDSLNEKKFKEITRRDNFQEVWAGIQKALEVGLKPVKLNVVVMRGFNDDELFDFVELTKKFNLNVRFIEYMPLGGEAEADKFMSSKEIKKLIKTKYQLFKANTKGSGPAKYFKVAGAKGTIGFISALSEHFCSSCNRLRLTADGKLKPCLASDLEISIPKKLTEQNIEKAYLKALNLKPSCHNLDFNDQSQKRTMSQIGG